MSKKQIFKIYQILNDTVDKTENDCLKIIEILIGRVNKKISDDKGKVKFYKPTNSTSIKHNISGNTSATIVLYKAHNSIEQMFHNFFRKELLGNEYLEKEEDMFICFVIIDNRIYFFSSLYSFSYFLSYVNEDFAIKVSKKLITGNIKYEKSISITGETLTSDIIFRGLKGFSKFDNLGKVIKGFVGEIDPKKSKKIVGLIITKNEEYFCEVGNAFTLKKSLDFEDTLQLIHDLDVLYMEVEKPDDYSDFQLIEKINPRFVENKKTIIQLEEVLSKEIFEYYKTGGDTLNFYELTPSNDFIKFMECIKFTLSYSGKSLEIEGLLKFKDIIDFIKSINPGIKTANALYDILKNDISLYGYNSDGTPLLNQSKKDITCYIVTEFNFGVKKYFCINGDFYHIKEIFLKTLEDDLLKELLEDNLYLDKTIESKLLEWDSSKTKTEGKYNESYIGQPNFLVLDRVFYKNIEFCDLLYNEAKQAYLFHNKKGFDKDMRVLGEQITLSALTLSETRKSGNIKIYNEYYNSLKKKSTSKSMKKIGLQHKKYPYKNFLPKLDNHSNINYVLAFTYTVDLISIFRSKNPIIIKKTLGKLSIIAKYELLILIKKMRYIGVNLFITQIKYK